MMGKLTFEFDYSEDVDEINMLLHMKDAYSALWDIDQSMRDKLKHDESITPEQKKLYIFIRDLCADPLKHYR